MRILSFITGARARAEGRRREALDSITGLMARANTDRYYSRTSGMNGAGKSDNVGNTSRPDPSRLVRLNILCAQLTDYHWRALDEPLAKLAVLLEAAEFADRLRADC